MADTNLRLSDLPAPNVRCRYGNCSPAHARTSHAKAKSSVAPYEWNLARALRFGKMPAVQAKDVVKLKKLHPLALVLATPVGYSEKWEAAMDDFLKIGETALPVYDRLSQYQREVDTFATLELEDVWECLDGEDDPCVDFYFPSDKFMIEMDKSRDKTLRTLRTIVARELEHHLLIAEICGLRNSTSGILLMTSCIPMGSTKRSNGCIIFIAYVIGNG